MNNNTNLESLESEIIRQVIKPLEKKLVTELLSFLKQENYIINTRYDSVKREHVKDNNFESIKVFEFEYDSPFDFTFIGGASPFTDDDWSGTAIISLGKEPRKTIYTIMENYSTKFNDYGTEEERNFRQSKENMIRDFFSKSWIEAKNQTTTTQKCFLSEHDRGNYYDCDLKVEVSESDLINLRE